MLYVAYGSNMNRRQMARRCPKARPLGGIWLQGWRLVMKRVADIEPDPHALTPAALWEITRSCERALDLYEGFPHLYIKERLAIALPNGRRAKPMAYVMSGPRQRDYGPASDGYL
ncbi:MAG: gamma-glutamylcyclotransferase, partial [Defluviicoccus sp.]|nr:gamma-glutamylcyclotransferase [Defluviicoccus sp.]